jgi:hypothetical protein
MEAVLMDAASVALLHGERGRDEVWWSFALCALGRALLAGSSSSSSSSASLAALLLVGALLRADSALLCGLLVGGAGALWPSWALPLLCGASGSWRSALSALVALLLLSTLLQHLQHQHNMLLLLSEWEALAALAPSVSLHWYFFAELFRPFGAFFAALWLLLLCASLLALARSRSFSCARSRMRAPRMRRLCSSRSPRSLRHRAARGPEPSTNGRSASAEWRCWLAGQLPRLDLRLLGAPGSALRR